MLAIAFLHYLDDNKVHTYILLVEKYIPWMINDDDD